MAQFYWEALDDDIGGPPSNCVLTQPWASWTSLNIGIETEPNTVTLLNERAHLICNASGSSRRGIIWSEIGGVEVPSSANSEIWMLFVPQGAGSDGRLALRMSGAASSENCYLGGYRRYTSNAQQGKYVSGTYSDIGTATYNPGYKAYEARHRVNGTTIQTKVWLHGDPEPETWTLSNTDASITTAGGHGLFQFNPSGSGSALRIFAVGIGTDGDTAPKEALSGGENVEALAASGAIGASGSQPVASATANVSALATSGAIEITGSIPVATATDAKEALAGSGSAEIAGSQPVAVPALCLL